MKYYIILYQWFLKTKNYLLHGLPRKMYPAETLSKIKHGWTKTYMANEIYKMWKMKQAILCEQLVK